MNRRIVIVLALVALGILGFYALNNFIYNEKQRNSMEETAVTSDTTTKKQQIVPISHATMVLNFGNQTVYTDPVGGKDAFAGQDAPDIILVTDIHGDHMDADTLAAITTNDTVIVVPQVVADELPDTLPGTVVVMNNGEKGTQKGIEIEAVPMYNMPESESSPHTKGRGNGYVISDGSQRIYIAGDTGATPEMQALQNIDIAFVPMNLPYTMTVDEAADGVIAFKPKVVHPYHYRGQDGLSDTNRFKELVEAADSNIKVELLDFYPAE